MWIVCGILSVIFTILNWMLSVQNNKKAHWAALCAISFTALTVLMEYRLVLIWVNHEDWAALMDVVPSMFRFLAQYVAILIFANALAFAWKKHRNS